MKNWTSIMCERYQEHANNKVFAKDQREFAGTTVGLPAEDHSVFVEICTHSVC